MWYGAGRTRKTSRVAGPRAARLIADRHGKTTDKGSYSLGDSRASRALRYARGATHRIIGLALVTAGLR